MTAQAYSKGKTIDLSSAPPDILLTDAQQYFSELHRIPPLSREEYQLCASQIRQYRQGLLDEQTGNAAKERMLHAHLLQVASLAATYAGAARKLDMLDLIQEGNLALLHVFAAYPFDEHGQFGKYLHKKIRWTLINVLHDGDQTIRIPARSLRSAQDKGQADALYQMQPLSLEQERAKHTRGEASECWSLLETLAAPTAGTVDDTKKARLVNLLLATLPERERTIVQLRFGYGEDGLSYTRSEVVAHLALSETTIRDSERHACQCLQDLLAVYAQTRGCAPASLLYDAAFLTYLEQQAAEQQRLQAQQPTQPVAERLAQAYQTLQATNPHVSTSALAEAAGVCLSVALRYLREQYHGSTPREHKQGETLTRLQQRGERVTARRLAQVAGVYKDAAWKYLRQHHP